MSPDATPEPERIDFTTVRQQVVGLLSAQGMSTRAIAPVVGITRQGVSKIQQREVATRLPPAPTAPEAIDFTTGEVTDQRGGMVPPSPASDVEEQEYRPVQPPAPRPAPIIGLDGKRCRRPAAGT